MKTIDSIITGYRKGTFTNLVTKRQARVRKSCTSNIDKITKYTNIRFGINYDNISQTKQKRQMGDIPQHNEGLPWGEWENYPYTIKHNGKRYLRFYAQSNKIKTTWIRDGVVVRKCEIDDMLLASERHDSSPDNIITLTIKEDNIVL